jgi:hypothetical protein
MAMRLQSLALTGLAVLGVAATGLLAAGPAAEAAPGKCLRFRDMTNMTKVDDRTLIAHTRGAAKFRVALRHACRDFGRPGNFYTVRLSSDTECFDRDDVLVFKYGGSCFVESVTPVPAG